jgi:hypothetical protein
MLSKAMTAAACAVFLLTGCGGGAQNGATFTTAGPTAAQESPAQTVEVPLQPSYQIISAELAQDGFHIQYPQIKALGDDGKENEINALIKNDIWESQVEDVIEDCQADDGTCKLNLDLKYRVTCRTEQIFCAVYTGTGYIEGGMHPNYICHAVTIDLNSGNRLYLTNFTEIDDTFVQQIKRSGTVTNVATEGADDGQLSQIRENLMVELQNQNDRDMVWTLKNSSDSNFCVTEDALTVCVGVSHAAGDYVLVELPGEYSADPDHTYDGNLCLDTENLIFSFHTEKSGKTVSLCISKDERYIVYRFGTKDNVELEFPQDRETSWDQFTYSHYLRGGGADNAGLELDSLKFENDGYGYEVYQEYDGVSGETLTGVRATEEASGKVTDIRGAADTAIGYWYGLRYNEKIRTAAQS